LFAAFEPSGDILAARLMEELKRRDPTLRFVAFGGPKMQAAGAELLEQTTEHATIALGVLGEVQNHRRRLKVLGEWLAKNDLAALVPVDSPAANWSVCKQARRHRPSARIVHLVCPQVWGWATWRVRRLERLSDRVLCLLPFEPDWLAARRVPGVFVGHPVYEHGGAPPQPVTAEGLPIDASVKLALMPGSRRSELESNWPTMHAVCAQLHAEVPGLRGVVALRDPADRAVFDKVAAQAGGLPEGIDVVAARTEDVLAWADVAFVKSGTSTLQVAARGVPMVTFYNAGKAAWHLAGRWLISTPTFALPNLISEWQGDGRAVPEFMPHFGDPGPLADALRPLLTDPAARAAQRAALARVGTAFASVDFASASADSLLEALDPPGTPARDRG
jgi:lipid-A-disaccharide synthase